MEFWLLDLSANYVWIIATESLSQQELASSCKSRLLLLNDAVSNVVKIDVFPILHINIRTHSLEADACNASNRYR